MRAFLGKTSWVEILFAVVFVAAAVVTAYGFVKATP